MNDIFYNHSDRRQNHRLAIHHHSRLRLTLDGAAPGEETIGGVTLTDISQEGLMAADAGQLLPGARIVLEIPLVGWREAEVMWIAGNRAGCRFIAPLNIEELRLAAASSDRLSKEFPGLATQIAELTHCDSAASVPANPAATSSSWQWSVFAFASLVIMSFAGASWFMA